MRRTGGHHDQRTEKEPRGLRIHEEYSGEQGTWRIALFSDGKLCDIFNDFGDGYMVGMERFGEGRFSVKRIGEPAVQLGAATLYAEPVQID